MSSSEGRTWVWVSATVSDGMFTDERVATVWDAKNEEDVSFFVDVSQVCGSMVVGEVLEVGDSRVLVRFRGNDGVTNVVLGRQYVFAAL